MTDPIDLVVPPQDLDAERAVLGSIAVDPRVIDLVAPIMQPRDLYSASNRAIFEAMLRLAERGTPPDAVTLRGELERSGRLEAIGGTPALRALVEEVPSAANAEHYARRVVDRAGVRSVRDAALSIVRALRDAPETSAPEACDLASRLLGAALERSSVDEGADLGDVAHEEVERAIRGERAPTASTGLGDLDRILGGGLPLGGLVVLAARPGCGKTSLAVQFARHASLAEGTGLAFFSLEMSRAEIARVALAQGSGLSAQVQRSGALDAGAAARLAAARDELRVARFRVYDAERTLSGIVARSRSLARRGGLRLVVVDYAQLVEVPGERRDETRAETVGRVSRGLKALARETGAAVLAAAQLNRAVESREGHKPRLSDLRESGSLEQDADVVLTLARETLHRDEKPDATRAVELAVLKHRGGPTGTLALTFDAGAQRLRATSRASPPCGWSAEVDARRFGERDAAGERP